MKILVCISHVLTLPQKFNFVNGDSEFDTNGVQYVINQIEFGLTLFGSKKKERNGYCCECWWT
jgi:hypothetical protein